MSHAISKLARATASLPLVIGMASIAWSPAAHAVTVNQVDIIDGEVAADMPPIESGPTGDGDEPTEA